MEKDDTVLAKWATDLRAELSTWPKEEIIELVIELAMKESVCKMVMDTKLQPALKEEHAKKKHLKELLKKRRSR